MPRRQLSLTVLADENMKCEMDGAGSAAAAAAGAASGPEWRLDAAPPAYPARPGTAR